MSKSFKSGLAILIILVLIGGGFIGYSVYITKKAGVARQTPANSTGNPSGFSSLDSETKGIKTKEFIAALYVTGTIEEANSTYNQSWLLSTINQLTSDNNNVAIAMYVNSPGGAVYQADEVYFALKDYVAKGKKLYVYMGPLAASGGYYISCPANKIYANRNTLTGSIGVISGELIDATELLDTIGIKIEAIHSGRNKLMGNFFEPITKEQEDILQSVSDECYDQFVSIVATDRKLSEKHVRELADGRVYTALQAQKLKLIDEIGTWDGMIEELRNHELMIPGCKVIAYRYEHKQSFRESVLGIISSIQQKEAASRLGIPSSMLEQIEKFNSYPAYLYK